MMEDRETVQRVEQGSELEEGGEEVSHDSSSSTGNQLTSSEMEVRPPTCTLCVNACTHVHVHAYIHSVMY